MNREDLSAKQKQSKNPLRMRGSDMNGQDFSNMDMSGVDFSFSSLNKVNFEGANLRDAILKFSSLKGTSFRNADLTNADLSFSNLNNADMTGARIAGANFSFSSQGVSWNNMSLSGVLQSQTWLGTVLAVLMGSVVVYGVSGIIYFTNQLVTASDPLVMRLNQWVVMNNILAGVMTVLLTQWMSSWLDNSFRKAYVRHLIISCIIIAAYLALTIGLFFWRGQAIFTELREQTQGGYQSAPWYFFTLGPLLVSNIVYYFGRQGRQLSRKISQQEYQLLNLEKLKTRAELDALQARISPHFLYNSLNSIASLVHEDPDKAEEMTLLLSKLFRYTTGRNTNDYYDTIAQELEMVRTYLQVEQVRFGDRLQFKVEVTNPALNELSVPKFIIQPLVENAIKHGISRLADQGCIVVRIYEENGWLHLCVQDNGPHFPEAMGAGYGIRSIQDKLKLLYGEDARIELHNQPLKYVDISIRKTRLSPESKSTH
ncbi:histidine kinase [Telluribacter sp.]|jgi:sensor histidine kinase YesM|uniref:histidine kinase n=1 Tax=Telluribacter sp. TaxID=1978767 RepID=UPI002E157415|nr:histidine kinase [Telluribacter sp.]